MKTRSFVWATVLTTVLGYTGAAMVSPLQIREQLDARIIKVDDPLTDRILIVSRIIKKDDPRFAKMLPVALAMVVGQQPTWRTAWSAIANPSLAYALIVNAGETALRDCFIATSCTTAQSFKFHGLGSGSTAAAETDTTCETEFTTQYNPDSTRATGSQTNNGANVYRSVGTNTVDASATARNFCLMSAASAGTMWTKIVFAGDISLASGDGVQTTYDLTIE